ncbi:phage baseplate protein [Bacillus sp. JJ722]|uniref:phage baseplate protein n=1 Tax=Bacillus sp. JJ722 TaxID=3122973 RepID=UPI002FFE9399
MPYLGDVYINIIDKVGRGKNVNTTDHAIEDGEPLTDHIEKQPTTLSISGLILDKDEKKLKKLEEYEEKGTLLTFSYKTKLDNVAITSFSSDRDVKVKNGYTFSMSLKQIRVVKQGKTVKTSGAVNKRTKSKKNLGRKQVKKK